MWVGVRGETPANDMLFVCRNDVLGASLRAQAPFFTCMVWQMYHTFSHSPTHAKTGCGGVGAPAVGAGGVWERPTPPLGDALPFGRVGLACGQRPRISGGMFFMQMSIDRHFAGFHA